MNVAQKAMNAGIPPMIGEQALAMAGGLAGVQLVPDPPAQTESVGPKLTRAELEAEAAELGKALQVPLAKGNKTIEALRGNRQPAKARSGNLIDDLRADAQRAKLARENEMRDREDAKANDRGFAEDTLSNRWDTRQDQLESREKDQKSKDKTLLADMAARFKRMRDGPD